jgi:hypothetical protein
MISRSQFLESVYALNGGNFQNYERYYDIPISEFVLLCAIHNEAIERQKKSMKG